jgi:sortase A
MNRKEIARFLALRTTGNFLVLFALYGVVATFGPALYFETHYRLDQIRGIHYEIALPFSQKQGSSSTANPAQNNQSQNQSANGAPEFSNVLKSQENVKILEPVNTDFGVIIPKIGANAPIFANVDANNESEFLPILKKGIAHAKGTVFPGMKGNIYLFAHSTDNFWDVGRYNAIFYLLKDLSPGDDIVVFFQNRRHNYKVVDSKIVDASNTSYLTNSQNSGKEQLILQTCWPPGTAWKRLLVIAEPKS